MNTPIIAPPARPERDCLAAQLDAAVSAWDKRDWPRPRAILVAGSGLGAQIGETVAGPLDLQELLPFPVHSLPGHNHDVRVIQVGGTGQKGTHVVSFGGRLHAYQGYSAHEVCFCIRLGALLGAKFLLMSNAAGGVNPELRPGDLVAVTDQLNLSGRNPLVGQLPPSWGPVFPDMSSAYDVELRQGLHVSALDLGFSLKEGVYASVLGPCYETPAEVRMLRTLGADLIGMSTVLEVIAAHQMGLECAVVSLVTNAAAGLGEEPLDHADVVEVGRVAGQRLQELWGEFLGRL